MISGGDKNVALTFEQLQQIEETKKTLQNLESEIAIAKKNLAVEKREVIKATKEREYQESLIERAKSELSEVHDQLEKIAVLRDGAADELRKSQEEKKKLDTEISEATVSLQSREDAVASAEKDIAERKAFLYSNQEEVEVKREQVERAAEAFKEAAETITWK